MRCIPNCSLLGISHDREEAGLRPGLVFTFHPKEELIMSIELIILIIVLIVLFGGGGGYYWNRRAR